MVESSFDKFLALFDDSQLGVSDTVIEDSRETLRRWIEWMRALDGQEDWIYSAGKVRQFKPETFIRCSAFMYDEDIDVPSEFMTPDLDIHWFKGRFIFPVFTSTGVPCGLVGWDAFEKPKYLDSRNLGYVAKSTTLLGMENMEQYLSNFDPVLFVEGSMDRCALLEGNFQVFGLLGSGITPYVAQIIRRFGSRAVILPDNDEAGEALARKARYHCREARVLRLNTANDVDDCRKVNINFYTNLHQTLQNPFKQLPL